MHNFLAYLIHRHSTDEAFRAQLENDPESAVDSCLGLTKDHAQLLAILKDTLPHLQMSRQSDGTLCSKALEGWTGGPSFTAAATSVSS